MAESGVFAQVYVSKRLKSQLCLALLSLVLMCIVSPLIAAPSSLFLAAEQNDIQALEALNSHNEELNQRNEQGKTPLHIAVENRHKEATLWLIEQGADLSIPMPIGDQLFPSSTGICAFLPDIELLKTLHQKGEDFRAIGPFETNVLHTLALFQSTPAHAQAIAYLIEIGVPVDGEGSGLTPLHLAINLGNTLGAKTFIEQGANIGEPVTVLNNPLSGHTPLSIAAMKGNKAIIAMLLAQGAQVNRRVLFGENALYFAAYAENAGTDVDLFSQLMDAGARPSQSLVDFLPDGSPTQTLVAGVLAEQKQASERFFDAIRQGDISALEQQNYDLARLNQIHPEWLTPLHVAIKAKQAESISWLLANGADPALDVGYHTDILRAAIESNSEPVLIAFIQQGIELEGYSKAQWIIEGKYAQFQAFLAQFPNWQLNKNDYRSDDALIALIDNEKTDILLELQARGLKFKEVAQFDNPLLKAIKTGNLTLVQLLAAEFEPHTKSYENPLEDALEGGHKAIAEHLIELGWGLSEYLSDETKLNWVSREPDYYAHMLCQQLGFNELEAVPLSLWQASLESILTQCDGDIISDQWSRKLLGDHVANHQFSIAELLISRGVDENYSRYGVSPLLEKLVVEENSQAVAFLLSQNALIYLLDDESRELLLALMQKHAALFQPVLETRAQNSGFSEDDLVAIADTLIQSGSDDFVELMREVIVAAKSTFVSSCTNQWRSDEQQLFCASHGWVNAAASDVSGLLHKVLIELAKGNEQNRETLVNLIDAEADLNARFEGGGEFGYLPQTPLMFVVMTGLHEVVELLLDKGADPNAVIDDRSALSNAGLSANLEIVRQLFNAASVLHQQQAHTDKLVSNLLQVPEFVDDNPEQREQAIGWLLTKDITPPDKLLVKAAGQGMHRLIGQIQQDSPDLITQQGLDAAILAAARPYEQFTLQSTRDEDYLNTLTLLNQLGANPNALAEGPFGGTDIVKNGNVITQALLKGSPALVAQLLDMDAKVPFRFAPEGFWGEQAGYAETLLLLTQDEQWQLVDRLFAAGANPDARLADGDTLLLKAVSEGELTVVQKLLEHGATSGLVGESAEPVFPLWRAVENNNIELVKLLISASADPNQRNTQQANQTSLMLALQRNYKAISLYLMENGANLSAEDLSGMSVAQYVQDLADESLTALFNKLRYDDEEALVADRIALYRSLIHGEAVIQATNTEGTLSIRTGLGINKHIAELWDETNQRPIRLLSQANDYSELLIAEFFNEQVLIGFSIDSVKLINIIDGGVRKEFEGFATEAVLSANKTWLAFASSDNTTLVNTASWDVAGQLDIGLIGALTIDEENALIRGVDGMQRYLTYNFAMTQVDSFDPFSQLYAHQPKAMAKLDDQHLLLLNQDGHYLWEWSVESKQTQSYYQGPSQQFEYFAVAPDGSSFVAIADDTLWQWQRGQAAPQQKKELDELGLASYLISGISYIHANQLLITQRDTIHITSLDSLKQVRTIAASFGDAIELTHLGKLDNQAIFSHQAGWFAWHEQTDELVELSLEEGNLVFSLVANNRIYGVTNQNTLVEYDAQLTKVKTQSLFSEQADSEQCLAKFTSIEGALLDENTLVLQCAKLRIGSSSFLYQVDLQTGTLAKVPDSDGLFDSLLPLSSTTLLALDGSDYSGRAIKQFTWRESAITNEAIFQDRGVGDNSVKQAMAFTALGNTLYYQGDSGEIRVLNQQSKVLEQSFSTEWRGPSEDLLVSADERWLARYNGYQLEVVNLEEQATHLIINSPHAIYALALADKLGLVFAGDEMGAITAYDMNSGEKIWISPFQQAAVRDITLFDNQQKLVHTGKHFSLRDTRDGSLLSEFSFDDAQPIKAFVDEAKQQLVGMTRRMPKANGENLRYQLQTIDLASGELLEQSDNQRLIAYANEGNTYLTQQAGHGASSYHFTDRHSGEQRTVSMTIDPGYFASKVKVFDGQVYVASHTGIQSTGQTDSALSVVAGFNQVAKSQFAFSADARWALHTSPLDQLTWYQVDGKKTLGCANLPSGMANRFAVEASSGDLWIQDQQGKFFSVAANAQGCQALVAESEPSINALTYFNTSEESSVERIEDIISLAAIAEKQQHLALANDNRVNVLSLETGKLSPVMQHRDYVHGLQFSPSGQRLMTNSGNNQIHIWDSESGALLLSGTIAHYEIEEVAFSADENMVTITTYLPIELEQVCGQFTCDDVIKRVDRVQQSFDVLSGKSNTLLTEQVAYEESQFEQSRLDQNGQSVTLEMTSPYAQFGWGRGNTVLSDDGKWAARSDLDRLAVWRDNGRPTFITSLNSIHHRLTAFVRDNRFVINVDNTGEVSFFNTQNGDKVSSFQLQRDGEWLLTNQDGRYDASQPGDIAHAAWVASNTPFEALPVEVFIKDFFEPRLLPKILSGETNFTSRQLANLNRVRPLVSIDNISQQADGLVSATVTVSEQVESLVENGKPVNKRSGINGLALFRDGRQVGFAALKGGEGDAPLVNKTLTFENIQLSEKAQGPISFSAFAFNQDNVKSQTARQSLVPEQRKTHSVRAFVITVGVNQFQNAAWDLNYASADATLINQVLSNQLTNNTQFAAVKSINLTSDSPQLMPSRQLIQAVFARLSGESVSDGLLARYPALGELDRVHPDDLMIFSYAGHGYAAPDGNFHLFPWDIAPGDSREVTDALLASTIDSAALEGMLRGIDSEQFIMIIDACNSAASVEGRAFRPGPMASTGLGQLAYNKKMIILTASQAEEFAVESDQLKHGLLTFSLIEEGLLTAKADYLPKDSQVFAKEWFGYALKRVPVLYQALVAGDFSAQNSRGIKVRPNTKVDNEEKQAAVTSTQKPGVFDFWQRQDLVIAAPNLNGQ